MTNEQVSAALRHGATAYPTDSLDRHACLRAAAWLRWMDAFGATIPTSAAEALHITRKPAEIARSIMAALVKSGLPTPPEDITLEYLAGDDGDSGHVPTFADTSRGPRP